MLVLITSVVSCFITILAQQLFHDSNKEFEAKVELRNELIKEQYEHLNKILNFSYRYHISTSRTVQRIANIVRYYDHFSHKVIKTDTIGYEYGDTTSIITSYSFIIEEDARKIFLADIKR